MDAGRNKANLQRLYDEVMNGHDLDAADNLITVDRPDHDPTFPPELTTGREGFKKLSGMLIAAFPDLRFTTDFMVAEGDMQFVRNTCVVRESPRTVVGSPRFCHQPW